MRKALQEAHLHRRSLPFLLLSAWLLMVPRLVPDGNAPSGGRLLLNAPVSQWDQFAAFDSARECEEERSDQIKSEAWRIGTRNLQLFPQDIPEVSRFPYARCIPADSIYPSLRSAQ